MGAVGCRGRSLWTAMGAVLFSSLVVWFLFICILANQASEKAVSRISSPTNLNILTLMPNRRHYLLGGPSFHAVSKRRVPNGPDPIHNRRAGNCKVPPTRA